MSQIEESRQHRDSGRLEARPLRQQLWKYANIHSLVGPPIQILRATRARESEVSPGSQLQKPGNQKSTWLLSGRSRKLQQGRGAGEGDAHQGRKKEQKKMAPCSFHPRENTGHQTFSRSDGCPSGWGAKTSQWTSPTKYPCHWTCCFLPGPCSR